jgi:UDP-N-acetylglucosamine 2-epimerase (non-hydrolysing)
VKTILFVFGTRPETIKLAPLILLAKRDPSFRVLVCSTGQHREMIKPLFKFFGIVPDFDLDLMKPGQSLTDISVGAMSGLATILSSHHVDGVVVQGDTTSCFIASLTAFYFKIPVIHVEAGLRSGDLYSPFPEEFNRKATGLIAKLHFAPTETAKANLLKESYSEKDIFVTGNTGIDTLFEVKKKILEDSALQAELEKKFRFLNPSQKIVLVTIHRRESFGPPLEEILNGLLFLAETENIQIVLPLHLNPEVRKTANNILSNKAKWADHTTEPKLTTNFWLTEPIDYIPFVYLMDRSHLIITDSGGIQEEAPALGKPVLVAREKTERPEGIVSGTSKLIPLRRIDFADAAKEILNSSDIYEGMVTAKNPFGDGKACGRILEVLKIRL